MLNAVELGNKIHQLRREKQMTQDHLGQLLHVSAQAVSKWEKGDSLPDISLVAKLAKAFGCTTDYLLGHSNNLQNILPQINAELKEMSAQQKIEFVGEMINMLGNRAPHNETPNTASHPSLTHIQLGTNGLHLWAKDRLIFIGTSEFLHEAYEALLHNTEFPMDMVPKEMITALLALLPDNEVMQPDYTIADSELRMRLPEDICFDKVITQCIEWGFADRVRGGYKLNLKADIAIRLISVVHRVITKPGTISLAFAKRNE